MNEFNLTSIFSIKWIWLSYKSKSQDHNIFHGDLQTIDKNWLIYSQYITWYKNVIKLKKIIVLKMKAWVVEDTRNVDATVQFAALFVAAAALAVLLQDPLTNSIILFHFLTKRRAGGFFCFLMGRTRIRHPHYKVYKTVVLQ